MTKAKRMMAEDIKLIDLVIELVDARIPFSSQNPDISKMANNKSRLILLNKSDLADNAITKEWEEYYSKQGYVVVKTDCRNRNGFNDIMASITKACAAKIERDRKRGIINRPVRAMVAGIPNVGKSTFINALCKKSCTKTGNKPGVTKGKQWIRLNKNVDLLDTPGILWPKFEDERIGRNLAFIGSINDDILNEEEVAAELIGFLNVRYPDVINSRYETGDSKDSFEILELIGRKRGCLRKGDEVDVAKAAGIILEDFRAGLLGHISLERPSDVE